MHTVTNEEKAYEIAPLFWAWKDYDKELEGDAGIGTPLFSNFLVDVRKVSIRLMKELPAVFSAIQQEIDSGKLVMDFYSGDREMCDQLAEIERLKRHIEVMLDNGLPYAGNAIDENLALVQRDVEAFRENFDINHVKLVCRNITACPTDGNARFWIEKYADIVRKNLALAQTA